MSTPLNSSRREWLSRVGKTGVAGLALSTLPVYARSSTAHVIVVGGGFGGATAARYLKRGDPSLKVTLIEPAQTFYTCPFTNLYLAGLRRFEQQGHGFDDLRAAGIDVIHDLATAVDSQAKTVTLAKGQKLSYDKLLLSPGIDFRWNTLEGYDEAASLLAPHAWKAGDQTRLLKSQLDAMPDGGTFIMVAPENPFRCPPGPYERASMVAHYFKQNKPKSKILILDAKDNFSKQGLFQDGWKQVYGDMIEWVPFSKDGKVTRVDAAKLSVETEFGEIHKANVLNVIPPQKAGAIAEQAGVTNASGWVPIDPHTFESEQVKDIYVVGDATIASPMPKSGFSANTQAKLAAASIINALSGKPTPQATLSNTCYSLIAPDYGISVGHLYAFADDKLAEASGGVSPKEASAAFRKQEAQYGEAWYAAISRDIWGTKG
ncbi:cytochrome c [Alcaligenes pakistanensis]|uniref:Cytochrome c n=1 Tax=Alcaligenes pakistanensis TaxID=1482717 RepID=A0A8H9IJW4_9BURK|nr:NAD(P)/FAD-dependent oxidoreductase [Alcaligenes pakistanensis]MBP6621769.1 FAD-dependent oxidoreductase [Alcaligenes sp.]GHC54705.1 cytochrome c [Alcaligenes pakistanensis]HCA16894.1 cytochrome C [Alcaligenes faecalis]